MDTGDGRLVRDGRPSQYELTGGEMTWPASYKHALDPIAVERSCYGDPVAVSVADRLEAVRRLSAAGRSGRTVAELLGVTRRTVCRYRAVLRKESGE